MHTLPSLGGRKEMEEVKSQNDLNQPETHSTEVLLSTIEELERTKKQLEIAIKCLRNYKSGTTDKWFAEVALEQIKELEK